MKIQRTRTWVPILLVVLLLAACGANDDDPVVRTATLSGLNEVPPVTTTASGEVTATLTGNSLEVDGSFTGLMSDLMVVAGSSAHVHMADAGANGGIVEALDVTSADDRSGTLAGTLTLTDDEAQAFRDGNLYVNIHTVNNGGGELRAQLD